jgi:thioester reductase-like protein
MSLNIHDIYKGKVILITGCTGFLGTHTFHYFITRNALGKVVLEKILRSLSNVKKIFILIRPKVINIE